jgi:carbamoyl-phosphate synthase large subunit
VQDEIRRQTEAMARALNVVGLMNVQFAIQGDTIFVLEVNPRASRTVPFVSKATGVRWPRLPPAAWPAHRLAEQGFTGNPAVLRVKEAVFPFIKFPGVDTILGPEMKSTGEVMGVGKSFAEAFVKSQLAAGVKLPRTGKVFLSVHVSPTRTARLTWHANCNAWALVSARPAAPLPSLAEAGIVVQVVNKVNEGRPHIVDMIKNGEIDVLVNTVDEKRQAIADSTPSAAAPCRRAFRTTTIAGAKRCAWAWRMWKSLMSTASRNCTPPSSLDVVDCRNVTASCALKL